MIIVLHWSFSLCKYSFTLVSLYDYGFYPGLSVFMIIVLPCSLSVIMVFPLVTLSLWLLFYPGLSLWLWFLPLSLSLYDYCFTLVSLYDYGFYPGLSVFMIMVFTLVSLSLWLLFCPGLSLWLWFLPWSLSLYDYCFTLVSLSMIMVFTLVSLSLWLWL